MIGVLLSPVGRWIGGAVALLAVIGGIYLKGASDERRNQKAKADAARIEHITDARELRNEIEKLDCDDLLDRAIGRLSGGVSGRSVQGCGEETPGNTASDGSNARPF